MRTYKLRYDTREESISDLKAKGILNENENPVNCSVVHIGKVVHTDGYDENGNAIIVKEDNNHHVDVLHENENMDFGDKEITLSNPVHKFWV